MTEKEEMYRRQVGGTNAALRRCRQDVRDISRDRDKWKRLAEELSSYEPPKYVVIYSKKGEVWFSKMFPTRTQVEKFVDYINGDVYLSLYRVLELQ